MIKVSRDIFNLKNIKYTKQRKLIYEILDGSSGPLSAQEVFFIAIKSKEDINLSTIYRILKLFLDKNLIVSVTVANTKKELFEMKKNFHNHYIICEKCDKKVPLKECPLKNFSDLIEEETGFFLSKHKLELYGLCSKCKNKS